MVFPRSAFGGAPLEFLNFSSKTDQVARAVEGFQWLLRLPRGLARCRQPTNRGRIVCEHLAMKLVSVLPMCLLACIACKHCDCV